MPMIGVSGGHAAPAASLGGMGAAITTAAATLMTALRLIQLIASFRAPHLARMRHHFPSTTT